MNRRETTGHRKKKNEEGKLKKEDKKHERIGKSKRKVWRWGVPFLPPSSLPPRASQSTSPPAVTAKGRGLRWNHTSPFSSPTKTHRPCENPEQTAS